MPYVRDMRVLAPVALLVALLAPAASAGELIYTPVNPAFGGAPANAIWLNQSAEGSNSFKRKRDRIEKLTADQYDPFKRDPVAEFSASLQSRLLTAMSDKIVTAIYGENKQNSGTFVAGGSTVSFVRTGKFVVLTISDGIKTTQITLPE